MMNLYSENLIACASDLTRRQGGGDAGNKERNKGK